MKPLVPYRTYDPDTSRILARLRNADSEFAKKERGVRSRCAKLLRRYRHRQIQRIRLREAQLLSEILLQAEAWKKKHQLAEEQRISEVVRMVLSFFFENAEDSMVGHVIGEVRKMLNSHPAREIVLLRVPPELEAGIKSAFSQMEIAVDPNLRGGVVVQTPNGEMEYSWRHQLQSILDHLSV